MKFDELSKRLEDKEQMINNLNKEIDELNSNLQVKSPISFDFSESSADKQGIKLKFKIKFVFNIFFRAFFKIKL